MATTYEEIRELFRETDRKFQETDRKFQETDRKFQETDRKFQETDRKFQATDDKFQVTDREFEKTKQMVEAQSRSIKDLEKLFTSQWGKLMESLVEGDLVELLVQRGIPVTDTTTRLKGKRADGGNYEFDIIAHNGEEVVVVEVKTTLRPDDVKDFLHKLAQMKAWVPRYAGNRILGAMAWLSADAGAETMVENRGLYSIRATGDSASIVNAEGFQPRTW